MYDTAQSAEHMELAAKEIDTLRHAVAEIESPEEIVGSSYPAAFTVCHAAYFYGLRVNAEIILAVVYLHSHAATYLLLKTTHSLAAVIKLTMGDEAREQVEAFTKKGLKQPVPVVYLF